jgi:hypothetical protein
MGWKDGDRSEPAERKQIHRGTTNFTLTGLLMEGVEPWNHLGTSVTNWGDLAWHFQHLPLEETVPTLSKERR